ncbi:MAG: UPF0175 family protein [Deltaproteobacteria bacterium]|nr:UPF0175 family protein [Deltaproteobacteria bacterium]
MPIVIEMPDDAASVLRRSPADFARAVREAAVAKWYELGLVSQSRAAEILGITRAALVQVLDRHQVAAIQTTADDLEEEVARG